MTAAILTPLGTFNDHVLGANVQLFYLIWLASLWDEQITPFEVHIPPEFALLLTRLYGFSESIMNYWEAGNQTVHVGCSLGLSKDFRKEYNILWAHVYRAKNASYSKITQCYVNDSR